MQDYVNAFLQFTIEINQNIPAQNNVEFIK